MQPTTPLLAGAAASSRLPGAVELMAAAAEAAGADAGAPGLLAAVDRVYVARGTWDHPDPGREVAARFGARPRTVVAELGVLQQTLITRACLDIAAGRADVVLVLGAEAGFSARRAGTPGAAAARPRPEGESGPDERMTPDGDVVAPLEVRRGLPLPVRQYAVLESALRAAEGASPREHAAGLARLWAAFSRVAAGNEDAWRRVPVTPADLAPSERNPMMALPYTRAHCSRMGVDQGAALLLCSARAADRAGVPRERRVFPVAAAQSDVMIPVAARPDPAASPGFAAVGEALTRLGGVAPADTAYVDLYSCFPAAVRLQARELGLTGREDLTVTGGMSFAGGPLNNYVLQSTVAMARALRADPGAHGLVTCVSGMVTKQAGALWSASAPRTGFRAEDVSARVRGRCAPLPLAEDATGPGTVAGYTVAYDKGRPERAIAVVTLDDGRRTVATSDDAATVAALCEGEWTGRRAEVRGEVLAV